MFKNVALLAFVGKSTAGISSYKGFSMTGQSTSPSVGDEEITANKQGGGKIHDRPQTTGAPKALSTKSQAKKSAQSFRTYRESERAKMMDAIAAKVRSSGCTFKEAIKDAGISEQTYYQWKKARPLLENLSSTEPARVDANPKVSKKISGTVAVGLASDEGPDIQKLQQENLRLRQVFAEKLLAANEELRKRIASL